MKFKKGDKRPEGAGRQKGQTNNLTKSVKEAFEIAFGELQADPKNNLVKWGSENTTEFYKLAAKLIPIQMNAKLTGGVKVNGTLNFIRARPKDD